MQDSKVRHIPTLPSRQLKQSGECSAFELTWRSWRCLLRQCSGGPSKTPKKSQNSTRADSSAGWSSGPLIGVCRFPPIPANSKKRKEKPCFAVSNALWTHGPPIGANRPKSGLIRCMYNEFSADRFPARPCRLDAGSRAKWHPNRNRRRGPQPLAYRLPAPLAPPARPATPVSPPLLSKVACGQRICLLSRTAQSKPSTPCGRENVPTAARPACGFHLSLLTSASRCCRSRGGSGSAFPGR